MHYFLQQLLYGLHAGALYGLLAFGYAMSNALLRRADLSFGALFAFAGQVLIFSAVWGWREFWLEWWAAVALGACIALAAVGLVARVLEQRVFAPLRSAPPNTVIVATLGTAIALSEGMRIAADARDLWLPPLLGQPVVLVESSIFTVTLTVIQLLSMATSVLAVFFLAVWLRFSFFGRAWRAVSEDKHAARLCGIDTVRVLHVTMLCAAGVAALAGMIAAVGFGNIAYGSGLFFGLKILFLAAAGGFATPLGAASGAVLFGVGEALWTGYFGADWRDGWMLGALAAVLVLRGNGVGGERPG